MSSGLFSFCFISISIIFLFPFILLAIYLFLKFVLKVEEEKKKFNKKSIFILIGFSFIYCFLAFMFFYLPYKGHVLLDNLNDKTVQSIFIGDKEVNKSKMITLLTNNENVCFSNPARNDYYHGTKLLILFKDGKQEKFSILYNKADKYIILNYSMSSKVYFFIPKLYQTLEDLKIDFK